MPSRYFEGNVQPEHHFIPEDFYCQIYFETVDTIANCIVERFNQKDYTMYANYEQVLLKGTLGNLYHKMSNNSVSSWSLILIPYEFSYLFAESYHSFRQGEGVGDTFYNIADFLKTNKKNSIPSYQRSCPWSGLFWLCQQQMPALNAPSVH